MHLCYTPNIVAVVHAFLPLAIPASEETGSRSLSTGVVKRDGYQEAAIHYKHCWPAQFCLQQAFDYR